MCLPLFVYQTSTPMVILLYSIGTMELIWCLFFRTCNLPHEYDHFLFVCNCMFATNFPIFRQLFRVGPFYFSHIIYKYYNLMQINLIECGSFCDSFVLFKMILSFYSTNFGVLTIFVLLFFVYISILFCKRHNFPDVWFEESVAYWNKWFNWIYEMWWLNFLTNINKIHINFARWMSYDRRKKVPSILC